MLQVQDPCDKRNTVTQPSYLYHMGNPYAWTESWYANSTHPFQIYLRHTQNKNTMLVTTAIFALMNPHQYLQTQPYFDTSVNYSWNIISLLSYIHIIQKPTFCAVPLKDQYYLHPAQHLHVQSKFTLKKVFIDTRSISGHGTSWHGIFWPQHLRSVSISIACYRYKIPVINVTRSHNHLIFITWEIPMPGRSLDMQTVPTRFKYTWDTPKTRTQCL